MLHTETIQNELSRTAKMLIDGGEAGTLEEAYAILGRYYLSVRVGRDLAASPTLQATLLTIVNTARRCFLGGVEVSGCPEANLLVHIDGCRSLKDAIVCLHGKLVEVPDPDHPAVVVGQGSGATQSEFVVRTTFEGWIGGVTPFRDGISLAESREFTPAGVLSGSLAVSEAFQFTSGKNPLAGRRPAGLSLWEPDSHESWLESKATGPDLLMLPSRLWLIGLGHLGQAYLWTLGMLPYASPEDVTILLQDTDKLTIANDSTSPLTDLTLEGRFKTRAMAEWCENRGFHTQIVERSFDSNFKIGGDDPVLALCGVDNAIARAGLEDVGFSAVIEAGLGRGSEEFLAFQIHSFPGTKAALVIWKNGHEESEDDSILRAAYVDLGARGLDQCGLTMLANRAVGASFVGTFASTLVIAEALRLIAGGPRYDVIDGTLRNPGSTILIRKADKVPELNPGITPAEPCSSIEDHGRDSNTCGAEKG